MKDKTPVRLLVHIPKDLRDAFDAITGCGFSIPMQHLYKYDNRGWEYGQWEVSIIDSDNIGVSYISEDRREVAGDLDFRFYFRGEDALENFCRWAGYAT